MKKIHLMGICLVAVLLLSALLLAVPARAETLSGTCGDNLTWTLDEAGTLTISGTGPMDDYTYSDKPWFDKDTGYSMLIYSVVVEEGVTSIGEYAFAGCSLVQEFVLPESLTSIGARAFESCERLVQLTLPSGVTSIGEVAFAGCFRLENCNIPDGVKEIPIGMFSGCEALKEIVIPNGVTSIGELAFSFCYSLRNVTIPDGVTYIGPEAFLECKRLTAVTIPASVTKIGGHAFSDCSSLWHVLYQGTQAQWDAISIKDHNDDLINAIRHNEWTGEERFDMESKNCAVCCEAGVHNYETTQNDATCITDGSVVTTCTGCGEMNVEVIPAEGHRFNPFKEVVTEATCAADGSIVNNCTKCGETKTEVIPALAHSFEEVTTNPNCTEAGSRDNVCTVCGHSETLEVIPAKGHNFGEWTQTREATRKTEGEEKRTCACGETETRQIPQLKGVSPVLYVVIGLVCAEAVILAIMIPRKKKKA